MLSCVAYLEEKLDEESYFMELNMARAYTIKGLKKLYIADIADVKDFSKIYDGELDFVDYWNRKSHCLTPFCFDYKNKSVVFVETPADIDLLTAHPFFYEAQRKYATKLYLVPFDLVKILSNEVKGFEGSKPIFLFSTGRCGSTLLCNLMGDNADIVSVSEPDYFTQLPFLRYKYGEGIDKELSQITRALTILLQAHIKTHSNCVATVFKFRSMALEAAELISNSVPEADHIYLYRNARDTINSFLSVLSAHPLLMLANGLNTKYLPLLSYIPVGIISFIPILKKNVEILAPLVKSSGYKTVGIGTGTSIFSLAWLSSLNKVLELQKGEQGFFKCIVRYDELKSDTFQVMKNIMLSFDFDEINETSKQSMMETMGKNSQAGSEMSSKGEKLLGARDFEIIENVLIKHSEIKGMEYILPGTIV